MNRGGLRSLGGRGSSGDHSLRDQGPGDPQMWAGATGKAVGLSSLDRSLLKGVHLTKIPQEETEAWQEDAMASQGQQQRPQNYRSATGKLAPGHMLQLSSQHKTKPANGCRQGHPTPSSDSFLYGYWGN